MNADEMSAQAQWDLMLVHERLIVLYDLAVTDKDHRTPLNILAGQQFYSLPEGLQDLLQRSHNGLGFSTEAQRRNTRSAFRIAGARYSFRVAFE
jgi:hypothetical protein